MENQVVCPHCKNSIPLTQALSHQVQEKYQKIVEEKLEKQALEFEKKSQEEKEDLQKTLKEKLQKQLEADMSLKLADTKNESEELKKQNKALQEQLLELNKLLRQMRTENEQRQLEMQKKLFEEEEKIRNQAKQKADEENKLKILEMEKKLTDAQKANEDLSRKLSQGSQQLQGEVLELELENILRSEFPLDDIKGVGKGITGADVVQKVCNKHGQVAGTIVWESKRTKAWSGDWIGKLKDDQRRLKAEIAVIISEVLPSDVKHFGYKDGVWVTSYQYISALAFALRRNLLEIAILKSSSVDKNGKMEILYNYLYGTEFQHRIEAILEGFTSLQEEMEREKRWFTQKWAKQEKKIRQVIDNTVGMRGDLQSITGKALPEVAGVDLLEDGVEETDRLL